MLEQTLHLKTVHKQIYNNMVLKDPLEETVKVGYWFIECYFIYASYVLKLWHTLALLFYPIKPMHSSCVMHFHCYFTLFNLCTHDMRCTSSDILLYLTYALQLCDALLLLFYPTWPMHSSYGMYLQLCYFKHFYLLTGSEETN